MPGLVSITRLLSRSEKPTGSWFTIGVEDLRGRVEPGRVGLAVNCLPVLKYESQVANSGATLAGSEGSPAALNRSLR
jgi:hypothetical protein